ncbi:MAG TPA: SDR family oxidoreductase [Jatrophihabitantaceae bacterium]|jgi:3-oxoacyl-[acyl-carrier protein] reductase
MDLHLRGARAVITGASQGIGLAIAHRLAEEGAQVGLIARDPARLDSAREALAAHGTTVLTRSADVAEPVALAAAVDGIAAELGGLDHVVANAGGAVGGAVLGESPAQVAASMAGTLALNVGHAVALVSSAVPHMAHGGSAVLIASVSGLRPTPRTTYATAKAAEVTLAVELAHELASQSIRVNAVSPGSIMFPGGGHEQFREQFPDEFATWLATEFPWGRLGTLDEVADVVAFLLSDRASWITGTNVVVDGGQGRPGARRFASRSPDADRTVR